MNKKVLIAAAFASMVIFNGCNSLIESIDSPKNMDEIIIRNNVDVRQCESELPAHSNSVILYYSDTKTCADYNRTEGDHCHVSYGNVDAIGDTTCVMGYDH